MRAAPPLCTPFRWACAGGLALILTLLLFRESEPSYQGKTITQWLYIRDPDFVWMPNDFYGHIHNELWERVLSGGYAAESAALTNYPLPSAIEVDPAMVAVQHMGTNALPYLLQFIAARPPRSEQFWNWASLRVPGRIGRLIWKSGVLRTAQRYHYAALQGFSALGSNAVPALPALSRLLERPGADFELGFSIEATGLKGRHVLVQALTNQDNNSRSVAAFCLGEDRSTTDEAIPLLLALVEHGQADYQVLGAIGRLGGPAQLVVPVLTRFLQRPGALSTGGFDSDMVILILGLYGEKAQSALPVIVKLYPDADPTTRQVIRVVIKHIQPDEAEHLLNRAPSKEDDEDPWWNGAKN